MKEKGKLDFTIIKKMREDRNLTRVQLSKNSEVPLTTLHDLEEGTTTNPRVLTLVSVADAFEISIAEFIGMLQE